MSTWKILFVVLFLIIAILFTGLILKKIVLKELYSPEIKVLMKGD